MDHKSSKIYRVDGYDSDNTPSRSSDLKEFKDLLEDGIESPRVQSQTRQVSSEANVSVQVEDNFLWLPSGKGMGSNYISRIERMKQMDLKPNYLVYYMYTPIGAGLFSLFLGVLLIILSLVLFFFSSTVKQEIPYTEKDTGPLTITLTKDYKPPIYIYYKISDFHVTHKRVVYDSDPTLVNTSSCRTFKTFADILDLRCINGKNTLNGVDEWCQNYRDNPNFEKKAYPCGPLAATIMTDNFEICPSEIPRNSSGNYEGVNFDSCLNITLHDQPELWKFAPYTIKRKDYEGGFCWIDLSNPLYHTWLQPPYTNSFLKPYGVIHDKVEEGEYKIHLVNNFWPSEEWKAKKAIYISCLNLVGSKSIVLEIVLLSISGLYILTGIVILILHWSGFKIKKSPWRSLARVTIGIVSEKEEMIRRLSTFGSDDHALEFPKPEGRCLCPLH